MDSIAVAVKRRIDITRLNLVVQSGLWDALDADDHNNDDNRMALNRYNCLSVRLCGWYGVLERW